MLYLHLLLNFISTQMNFLHLGRGLIGILVILGICYLFSRDKKSINWLLVGIGIPVLMVFSWLALKFPFVTDGFKAVGMLFDRLAFYTQEGASFVFGPLAFGPGQKTSIGFIFAFQVLPSIIMISALMSFLYYVGIMQRVVRGIAWVMEKLLRVSGAESLVAASNIFVGQTEAPLFIKPYVRNLTHSEILSVMTAGMATLASGVMASYISMLGGGDSAKTAEFGANLFAASIMGSFASLIISKILVPEKEVPETNADFKPKFEKNASNVVEAVANGAADGLKLAANVGGMLLAFIALIALLNEVLYAFGAPYIGGQKLYDLNEWVKAISGGQFQSLSLQSIFGFFLAPFAWLMGVDNQDILQFGRLLGEKIALNEYVAYVSLNDLQHEMEYRTVVMATYALCGFANFSSIAIQIGGIGGLAPERKGEIAKYGMLAVLGGMLSTCLGATIAGMWL